MLNYTLIFIYAITSFILTNLFILFFKKNANKFNLIDLPDSRKGHIESTPVVGGIAIFSSFIIFLILFILIGEINVNITNIELVSLICSTFIIILIGFLDDCYKLKTYKKIIFQFLASIIFLYGFQFNEIVFFNIYFIDLIISLFFIIGITNSINLLDGLDRLAGGVCIIIITSFLILNLISGIHGTYILFIVIISSLFSFMVYNNKPAKIFLGDMGSLFLGWFLAIVSIFYINYSTHELSILLPMMLLALPAFDVIFVMIDRFINKNHTSFLNRLLGVFRADNIHIHHILLKSNLSEKNAIIVLYLYTLFSCTVAIVSFYKVGNIILNFIFLLILFVSIRYYYNSKK